MTSFVEGGRGTCGGFRVVIGYKDGCDGLDDQWVGVEFRQLGLEDGEG